MRRRLELTRRQLRIILSVAVAIVVAGGVAWVTHVSRIDHYQVRWDNGRRPPTVSADGRSVDLQYIGGECDDYADAEITETNSKVTITVTVTTKATNGCSDVGVPRTMTIHLEEPLGDRKLVDGAD